MENTFDINSFSEDRLAEAASFKQCRGLSLKFAKDPKTQKMDWRKQKQILGCLFVKFDSSSYLFCDKKCHSST